MDATDTPVNPPEGRTVPVGVDHDPASETESPKPGVTRSDRRPDLISAWRAGGLISRLTWEIGRASWRERV